MQRLRVATGTSGLLLVSIVLLTVQQVQALGWLYAPAPLLLFIRGFGRIVLEIAK